MKSSAKLKLLILFCITALLLPSYNLYGRQTDEKADDNPVTAKTIRNSAFFVQTRINAYTSTEYPPFRVLNIKKGTEMELLAFNRRFSEFITVRAEDGSVGYVPASAFADATLTVGEKYLIRQTNSGESIPDGKYSVVLSGKDSFDYVYRSYNGYSSPILNWSAQPQSVKLVGRRGSFDITKRYLPSFCEKFLLKDGDRMIPIFDKLYSVFNYGQLDSLLNRLPQYYNVIEKYYRFDPKAHDLNEFVGHKREELEKIIGKPYAEVGHLLGIADSTFAFYDNVIWPVDEEHFNCGIGVSYDNDSNIGFIKRIPVSWISKRNHSISKLRFPSKPLPSAAVSDERGEQMNLPSLKSAAGNFLDTLKHLWANKFEIYEEIFGIYDVWPVLGIMLLIQIVFGIIITILVYLLNYGSNGWALFRCLFLPMCLTLFNVIYFWKNVGFYSILAVPLFLLAGLIPFFILHRQIADDRCPNCRHYVDPLILKTKEGNFKGHNCVKNGPGVLLNSWRNGGGDGMSGYSTHTRRYKYRTLMRVTQNMEYHVKCPYCGYEWEQHKEEARPYVKGPILVETVEKVHSYSTRKETTRTELRSYSGSVLDSHEDSEYMTDTNTDTYTSRRYDNDRYHPYFIEYVNGDTDALNRYYEKYWDDVS